MGSKMNPLCNSLALWAPPGRATSRGGAAAGLALSFPPPHGAAGCQRCTAPSAANMAFEFSLFPSRDPARVLCSGTKTMIGAWLMTLAKDANDRSSGLG